jgi:hypothetical protein
MPNCNQLNGALYLIEFDMGIIERCNIYRIVGFSSFPVEY